MKYALWLASTLTLAACGGESGTTDPDPDLNAASNADANVDPNANIDPNAQTGEFTLQNCGGSVADDVPAFFGKYFRCIDISMDGDEVVMQTANLPPHRTNYYGDGHPNYEPFDTSRGPDYRANPNTLAEQDITIRIPVDPVSKGLTIEADMVDTQMNTHPEEYGGGPRGVALDSIVLFDDQAAPGDDINDEKFTFDRYNAHPAMTTYHYHTASDGPLEVLAAIGESDVELYGIMCDGTVVLGCTELDGTAPSAADLDAQNGHVGDIVDGDGTLHFADRYHTHICPGTFDHEFTPEIQWYESCGVAGR